MDLIRTIFERRSCYLILAVLAGITIIAIFIPLRPDMPASGLDPSWRFALNYANVAGLDFGRDIIFTFGPYASIYTVEYNPGTDRLMMLGSCFLATFYLIALYQIWTRVRIFWLVVFIYVIATFNYIKDTSLASYPLLLSIVFFYKAANSCSMNSERSGAYLGLLAAPLGLLPLIKGSLLAMPIALIPLYCWLFWISGLHRAAIVAFLSPVLTMLGAWVLAGQPLTDLPAYFRAMADIISGYTDAMSIDGPPIQVVIFLAAAAGILIYLLKEQKLTFNDRIFLATSFGAFLFITFKGGFVRHDGHALIAGNGILTAIAMLGLANLGNPRFPVIFLGVAICAFYIDFRIIHSTKEIVFENFISPYRRLVIGIETRAQRRDVLTEEYNKGLETIRSNLAIRPMPGTSDIYAYNQSYLLASNNNWSPRPVLQSYSAYTPWLVSRNSEHLNREPPDNIVFRVETIDNRIPSLDDGASWPTVLNSYTPQKLADDYAYLERSGSVLPPMLTVIQNETHSLGETVQLPKSDQVLFAKMAIRKTLVGKIISFLYKPTPLNVTFVLATGDERTFRIIPGIAGAGFIISPLVESTSEFARLYGDRINLKDKEVDSIRVYSSRWGNFIWNAGYNLEVSSIDMTRAEARRQIAALAPVQFGLPSGVEKAADENCESAIDTINGAPPSSMKPAFNLLTLSGWMTVPESEERFPQRMFVTATDANGTKAYVPTDRVARPDVRDYFRRPAMPEPGFSASANLQDLKGDLTIGLARERQGKLHDCNNTSVRLLRADEPVSHLDELQKIDVTAENATRTCEGVVDYINGTKPSLVQNTVGRSLSIAGWTTLAGKDGRTPDAVFVTLTGSDGKKRYARTHRIVRPDVASHFGRQEALEAGFNATIPTSKLSGDLRVGIARLKGGALEACSNLSFPVSVSR